MFGLEGHPVARLACGQRFTAVVTAAGGVWTWGEGSLGQLGTGRCTRRSVPTAVALPAPTGAAAARMVEGETTTATRVVRVPDPDFALAAPPPELQLSSGPEEPVSVLVSPAVPLSEMTDSEPQGSNPSNPAGSSPVVTVTFTVDKADGSRPARSFVAAL